MSSNNFDDLEKWTQEFQQKKGRPLRVLHIGNIAANGYLNAKFQRELGIEADVLCNDYYHIMAYPEWEEVAISDNYGQDIKPLFPSKDLKTYKRPKWFVQGPLILCFDYLIAKNEGQSIKAKKHWQTLSNYLNHNGKVKYNFLKNRVLRKETLFKLLKKVESKANRLIFNNQFLQRNLSPRTKRALMKMVFFAQNTTYKIILRKNKQTFTFEEQQFVDGLNQQYRQYFPNRAYTFTKEEIRPYLCYREKWEKLLSFYDVVQCYGTDPIYGLLFSKKPYLCFEHGTLRVYTSDDSSINALTSLAYRKAQHVFITNGDCLEYAMKLNIDNYSPMIHPVDVQQHRNIDSDKVATLRSSFDADVLLFCPLRHDWEIKGTEKHIYALKIVNDLLPSKPKMVMTNWGQDLEKSKTLAKDLGIYEQIIWIQPLSRIKMIEMIHASDVILDQTILPCFGSTSPQALACGVPTIMSYEPDSTAWLIKKPAPILSASTVEDIAQCIQKALDPNWKKAFKLSAEEWINQYHSCEVALKTQLKVYKQMLEEAS